MWHKVLKSGTRREARRLGSAARLERYLSLCSVLAWRILYATMLARAAPKVPCRVLWEEPEWQALFCRIHRTPQPPPQPPSLRAAVRAIAQRGGFLARKGDGEPGVTTLWRGFEQLHKITAMYQIFTSQNQTQAKLNTATKRCGDKSASTCRGAELS